MLRKLKEFFTYWLVKVTHGMLTCAEADAFMVDYLDYRLDAEARERFEKHLRNCVCCKGFLSAYQRTIELSRAYGEGISTTAPPRMPAAVMQAILAARREGGEPSS